MSIRICSGYRTISSEAAGVIAGIPPIELQIQERKEKYDGENKETTQANLLARWQTKWNSGTYGRWTWKLIPDVQRWLKRPCGEVDYFLTQALSGHGCFRKYLYDRNRADSEKCRYCDAVDDVHHTLFTCSRWEEERTQFTTETGNVFNANNMMESLTTSERAWTIAYAAIRRIIQTKEREER